DPRRLGQLLRGDLDWIVMKALDKDRTRRYDTASGLERDIQRYLQDEPVEACPPSAWYRFRKFARRNKAALTVALCLFVVAATMVGSIGWVMRDQEARRAKTTDDIQLALERAELLQHQGKRAEALAAFDRAEQLAGDMALDPAWRQRLATLKERLDAEAQDQDFVAQFGEIRLLEQSQVNQKESRFTARTAFPK